MIKLAEIIHKMEASNKEGLTDLDNWKITDADFLTDMGFEQSGIHYFTLKNPHLTVCHKKGVGFVLEDKSKKQSYTFPTFNELIEYFTKYQQEWENQPYL